MKTNVTLKLDADLLREARILAAEEDTSISAMLAARLEQIVRERRTYHRASKRALARLSEGLDLRWSPPPLPRRTSRAVTFAKERDRVVLRLRRHLGSLPPTFPQHPCDI